MLPLNGTSLHIWQWLTFPLRVLVWYPWYALANPDKCLPVRVRVWAYYIWSFEGGCVWGVGWGLCVCVCWGGGGEGPAQNAHSGVKREWFLDAALRHNTWLLPRCWSSRDIQACCISSSQVKWISHLSKSNKDMYCIEILYKYDHNFESNDITTITHTLQICRYQYAQPYAHVHSNASLWIWDHK